MDVGVGGSVGVATEHSSSSRTVCSGSGWIAISISISISISKSNSIGIDIVQGCGRPCTSRLYEVATSRPISVKVGNVGVGLEGIVGSVAGVGVGNRVRAARMLGFQSYGFDVELYDLLRG